MQVVTTTERIIEALSYSELTAIAALYGKLENNELLVAKDIADGASLTRSIIVNALRKLSAAGVIDTRSLGRSGTLIKVLNREAFDEIVQAGV
jgi:transcriptional pleiotropic repressor